MTATTAQDRRTVRCPSCGHAVSVVTRQTAFCPHCGRRLRAGHPVLAAVGIGCVLVAIIAGLWSHAESGGVRRVLPAVAPAVDQTDVTLADADAVRVARAAELDRRADDVRSVRQSLVDQVAELSNLSARITTAANRAADEDRWPAKVGGRSLMPTDADEWRAHLADTISHERRAIDRDGEVLDGLTAATAAVRAESTDIGQLRHELAASPPPDRRAVIGGRAADYRDAAARPPDAAGLTADPTRPVDADALLH